MNFFNIKQDIKKIRQGILCFLTILGLAPTLLAQNTSETCITIPFTSNSLIKINKSNGQETTVGNIGVRRVQAIALNATVDTIYAARPGQLGYLTFDDTQFTPLPQAFGTGEGALGSIEFIEVEGLSLDLGSNTLYGSVKIAEPSDDILIQIDPQTGAHIPDAFGPGIDYVVISGSGVLSIVEDIAINPRDGVMYALTREELGNDVLIKTNKQDGSSEVVGPAGINILEGLGFDNRGNLYATPGFNTSLPPRFFQMDLSTGEAITVGELTSLDYESCDCRSLNSSPIAQDDNYQTPVGETLEDEAPGVLGNDSDPDGDEIAIVSYDTTTNVGGTVVLDPDGGFNYTPPEGFEGKDSFSYVVEDELGDTDSATVRIVVGSPENNAPEARDDNFSTDVDTMLEVDGPGVLANDLDPDGDQLVIIKHDTTTAAGGSVEVNEDGGFSYTPPDGFEGDDEFDYVVSDGFGKSDTATVTVSVIRDAQDPVANDDVYTTEINTSLDIDSPGVLANDTDPNGDALTVVDFDQDTGLGGTVEVNEDGGFSYTPPADSTGTDSFYYVVSDPDGNTDTALVSIEVKEPVSQNNPPIAVDDDYMTDQDADFEVTDPTEGILVNDSDPDGDEIAVVEVTDAITDHGGRISINSDGTFIYVPDLGYTGTDTYEYVICDNGDPVLCDSATIYIEVKELPIEVFNAFSPNGDGVNDSWVIQGITRFPDNHIQIFNRWGNLIYEETGYDNTAKVWTGESTEGLVFGGDGVPDGAYYYIIELGDGSARLEGYVVVRR